MFDSERQSLGFSLGLCILQLLAVPIVALVLGVLIGQIFEKLTGITARDGKADLILGYLLFLVVGVAIGYFAQTIAPRARVSGGNWVWVLPCCVLIWGVLEQSSAPGTVMGTYFTYVPGDEGLGITLITFPAVASCLYPLGAALASRKSGDSPHVSAPLSRR